MFKKVVSFCLSAAVAMSLGVVVRAENSESWQQNCRKFCAQISDIKKVIKQQEKDIMKLESQWEKQENQREKLEQKKNLGLKYLSEGNCSFFKKMRVKFGLFLLEKIEKYDKIGITKESVENLNRSLENEKMLLKKLIVITDEVCYPEYSCTEVKGEEL